MKISSWSKKNKNYSDQLQPSYKHTKERYIKQEQYQITLYFEKTKTKCKLLILKFWPNWWWIKTTILGSEQSHLETNTNDLWKRIEKFNLDKNQDQEKDFWSSQNQLWEHEELKINYFQKEISFWQVITSEVLIYLSVL